MSWFGWACVVGLVGLVGLVEWDSVGVEFGLVGAIIHVRCIVCPVVPVVWEYVSVYLCVCICVCVCVCVFLYDCGCVCLRLSFFSC